MNNVRGNILSSSYIFQRHEVTCEFAMNATPYTRCDMAERAASPLK